MDAVKFLKETKRMCDTCSDFRRRGCGECPARSEGFCFFEITNGYAEEKVAIVEKWSKEHPVKTRMSEFLKQHPKAALNPVDKLPVVAPCTLDCSLRERLCKVDFSCSECREKYWLEELE